ncbi:MAG: GspH/FimT family pseudopilin [Burkholderiaceae bacterium]|nr:GspH/FimT family pseudopilin [Burkholderiaceae bacterium]
MKNLPRGFTLIEMMTVVALIAIIGALAAPDLRAFVIRNKVAGVSNEFSAALQQARALAVSRNSCMSLCVASSNNAGTCMANTVDDVNFLATGWLIFQNPGCDAAKTDPEDAVAGPILQQRSGEAGNYVLRASASELNIVLFDPRGYANLAAVGNFQIEPPPGADASYRRTICLDAAGRSTVRQFVEDDPCT